MLLTAVHIDDNELTNDSVISDIWAGPGRN